MSTFENRDKFIAKLLEVCEDLNWTRSQQELTTFIGGNGASGSGIKVRCESTREGTFLQIIPPGEYMGPTINEKKDKRVSEIHDKVWKFINQTNEDKKWAKALDALNAMV